MVKSDLDGEIDVAGRIDQLNQVFSPRQFGDGGGDGDAVLLLFDQIIHVGRTFVDLADFVRSTGVVQHPLGQGSFASVYVCGDTDVAHQSKIWSLGHEILFDLKIAVEFTVKLIQKAASGVDLPNKYNALIYEAFI